MSFTSDVKSEICHNILKECCIKGELSAFIKICSSINISNNQKSLLIKSENPTTAKRILSLLKKLYKIECEISVVRKMNLKKNNVYYIKVLTNVDFILLDLGLFENGQFREFPTRNIIRKECCARAYLAGTFISCGSINSPVNSNYHLELSLFNEPQALFIKRLLNRFYINSKIIKRRKNYIVYTKASENIFEFLRCIGASETLMKFEEIRINRDYLNNLVRLNNCEIANEMKIQKTANEQLKQIEIIENSNYYKNLDKNTIDIMNIRKKYPEQSYNEIVDIYKTKHNQQISKSGVKHRFNKVKEIYLDIIFNKKEIGI